MGTIRFTSDLHLGHPKVAEIRGFESTDEHDEHLAWRWRTFVHEHDVVYVLGDVSGDGGQAHALEILRGLPGEKRLILGNHDAAHPLHSRAFRHLAEYLDVFSYVAPFGHVKIGGRRVLLSHFPYRRDRETVRHAQWRLRDEGAWLLHGHTHGPERLTASEREIHVGADAWGFRPVSLDEVGALIREGEALRDLV